VGRGVKGVSYVHTARGRCPSAPQFGGSLLFVHTPFDAELPNFIVATPVGRGLVVKPHPKRTGPSASQFGGFICKPFVTELYQI